MISIDLINKAHMQLYRALWDDVWNRDKKKFTRIHFDSRGNLYMVTRRGVYMRIGAKFK